MNRALLLVCVLGCAKGGTTGETSTTTDAPTTVVPPDGCGELCDSDMDGVPDGTDKCPSTPAGAPVNKKGCADSQTTATLEPVFPSYGLTWTPTGSIGRAGGMTWTYTGINRGDLFHIWWTVCDDPTTPCGLSLDGPIDQSFEHFSLTPNDVDLAAGKLVFVNTTHINLADTTMPVLSGRMTISITDMSGAAIPFATMATLGITARMSPAGAEIKGIGFKVNAIMEVQDPIALTYSPALDYYDAAATPDTGDAGGNAYVSLDGEFYDK